MSPDHLFTVETTPLARAAARARQIGRPALDTSVVATRDRLRALGTEFDGDVDQIVAMGNLHRTEHGGSFHTFSGGRAHENGWWPGWKRRRNQHWEGMTQRHALAIHETDNATRWAQTEPHKLEFHYKGRLRGYTPDLDVMLVSGANEIWELKRGLEDLGDSDYRDTLAGACEIYRRCGIVFRIVFRDELFSSQRHRNNVELFASRRFARLGPEHLERLSRHATQTASRTTYGALAEALEPRFPAGGRAVVQALRVRRRIDIDLTARLDDEAAVCILPVFGARR